MSLRYRAIAPILVLFLCILGLAFNSYAKEITILYSGETHAMLYPCNCPKEPDGGIARRLTLLKQLKKKYPDSLIVDSGAYSAGGLTDEYSQNTDLDMERTRLNLKAMELAGYDAAGIGDDELSFGEKFFQENIGSGSAEGAKRTQFVSCNLKAPKVVPFLIKDVAGTKIGIIGVTSLQARQKAEKFAVDEPKTKLIETISQARKNGAQIILVLGHLSEGEEADILNAVEGIDIFISGHSRAKEVYYKVGNVLVLKPSWQGRRLGRVTFEVKNNRIANYKTEEARLSDKVADDPQVLKFLPRCFSDAGCKKEGLVGICQNPGTSGASCIFSEAQKINLFVVTAKVCVICNAEGIIKSLKKNFPGLSVNTLYYPDSVKAKKLVQDFGVTGLPAFFMGKEVEKEPRFSDMKASMELKGDLYYLKAKIFGYSYLIERKRVKGKLDVFLSLYDQEKDPVALLEVLKSMNPDIHFLAVEKDSGFDAMKGSAEVEEYLRGVCVAKYYPEMFWDYLSCRARNISSAWWEDCLGKKGSSAIKACAQGEESRKLLKENIALGKELGIMLGPVCLTDNQEVSSCSASKAK